jgi:hypothetical protein
MEKSSEEYCPTRREYFLAHVVAGLMANPDKDTVALGTKETVLIAFDMVDEMEKWIDAEESDES